MTTAVRTTEVCHGVKRKADWDECFKTEEHHEWLGGYSDVATLLGDDVPEKDASILILGCGNSAFSAQMADAGYTNITSIDFRNVVIATMVEKHRERHPGLKWIQADVRRLDSAFERHTFDVVVDKSYLNMLVSDEGDSNQQMVAEMEQALNSIARVIKVGGLFVSIGSPQQPLFREQYLKRQSCSFGWEKNISVQRIAGGCFYTRCRKDLLNHMVMPVEVPDLETEVVRVYTCVCGDLWHSGHAKLCQNSRALGGPNAKLIVGICSDEAVTSYKRKPIMTALERGMAASTCRWVDEVVFDCPFVLTEEFVDRMNIHIVTHGDDHSSASVKKYYQVALDRGIYRTVPYTQGVSTTDLIERCCAQGAARAAPHGA